MIVTKEMENYLSFLNKRLLEISNEIDTLDVLTDSGKELAKKLYMELEQLKIGVNKEIVSVKQQEE